MCKQHPGLVKARASALVLSFLLSLVSCALHAATLSGVVKDQMGKPIDGAYARLFEVRNSLFYQSGDIIQVGADGAYQWDVSPGTYVLRAYFDGSDVALTGAPYRTVISSEDFDVNSDTVRDSLFDFVLLSGKVVDSNQSPIANVEIATATSWHGPEQGPALKRSQYSLNHSAGSVTTDADGNYAMLLFASNPCVASDYYADSTDCFYDLSFTPPNGSGFSSATQADIAINSARVLDQELTLLDSLNPKIIAGPYVKNITDQSVVLEWQTDEPVTASVQIINGATLTSDSLQSRHSVLINNLDPATEYSAQINTYDAQSNSTSSAIFTFSTASSHSDSLAPSFLQSPKATAISEHQFSVAFCADEPVSGKFLVENVDYAFAEPATCHALTVENLESNTSYAVAAEISDLAGNGPISSQTSMIKTLAAADLNPPLIIAGPSITDISDVSAIVKWTTNEPASSAVSFNDGSAYRAQSDPELVTEHALRITGLSAETSYQLSVASEDAAGNRSASGDARQFTTEAAPDTTAPVLIGRALVEDISASGATISWRSDESSSTVLYLGTNANSLNQLETAAGFSNLHRISVSNLQPNTRYYYVVESGDLAGNTVQSAVSSFTTLSAETSDTLEIISQAVIERLSGNSLTLSWRTNRYADSRLICESSNGSAEVNKTELSKQHLLTLIGLDFNTAYRCVVYSSDIEGRIASTVIGALTTDEVDSSAPQCVVPPEAQAAAGVAEISWQSNELATAVLNYRVKGTEQWSQNNHPSLSRSGFDLLTGLTAYTD